MHYGPQGSVGSSPAKTLEFSWPVFGRRLRCGGLTLRGTRCKFRARWHLHLERNGKFIGRYEVCKIHSMTRRFW